MGGGPQRERRGQRHNKPPICPLPSKWREGTEMCPASSELRESGLLTAAPPALTSVAIREPEPEAARVKGRRLLSVNVVSMGPPWRCVSSPSLCSGGTVRAVRVVRAGPLQAPFPGAGLKCTASPPTSPLSPGWGAGTKEGMGNNTASPLHLRNRCGILDPGLSRTNTLVTPSSRHPKTASTELRRNDRFRRSHTEAMQAALLRCHKRRAGQGPTTLLSSTEPSALPLGSSNKSSQHLRLNVLRKVQPRVTPSHQQDRIDLLFQIHGFLKAGFIWQQGKLFRCMLLLQVCSVKNLLQQ